MEQVVRSKDLYLFTNEYPYGKGETFIENELYALSEQFRKIYIFPLTSKGPSRPLTGSSIQVVDLFKKEKISKWKLFLRHFFLIFTVLRFEFKHVPFSKFKKSFTTLKSVLLINLYRAGVLEDYLKTTAIDSTVFYSFWTDDWATVLSILTSQKKIPSFISRVHGYDLYQERWPNETIPFRNFQLKYVSKIITASADGLHYMQTNYPAYRSKFYLQHLNVKDRGSNPFFEEDEFVVVSCSNIVPLKRVEIIFTLLAKLPFKVRWIHIGAGAGMNNLKELVLKNGSGNIEVELRGHLENEQLIQFYQTQKINLFIHLSETEGGVPLVLQEAASFGIPLLGADAGGVREIVTAETGVLIPLHFREEEAIEQLKRMHSSAYNNTEFRKKVKAFWNAHFNADKNKSKLVDLIINL